MQNVLVFQLDQIRMALPVSVVEHVVQVVEMQELPGAPEIVLGTINFHGVRTPVLNLRLRLGLPPRAVELSDELIVAKWGKRLVALLVDAVEEVRELSSSEIAAAPEAGRTFLLRDPMQLLSAAEIESLEAMAAT